MKIAAIPVIKLIIVYKKAEAYCPACSNSKFSKEKVEKVEKPPQKPVIANNLTELLMSFLSE